MRIASLLLAIAAAGCTPGGSVGTFPTGSSTIATVGRQVYTVSPWDGTLAMVDTRTGSEAELELGGRPTRIARVGDDELWVTLRAERAVVVLRTADSGLPEEVARIHTGPEPHGIVATPDGSRVYVAVSQADEVLEIDGSTKEILRKWAVQDDPRWLALHPSGEALFVISAFDAPFTRIDLEDGTQTFIDAPQTERPADTEGTSASPGGDSGSGPDIDVILHHRPTGDPSISPDGSVLVVPTLYADTTTPVEQPDDTEPPPDGGGYSSSGATNGVLLGIGRMNPAIVGVALNPRDGTTTDDPVIAFFVSGQDSRGAHRGYVSSATFSTDGTKVYATMESADAVAVVDLRPADGQGMDPSSTAAGEPAFDDGTFHPPASGGFYERNQVFVPTRGNPSGLAFDADGFPWVHERGARSVAWLRASHLESALDGGVRGFDARDDVGGRFADGTSRLDDEVEEGLRLFYFAIDSRMAADGAGVSCGTCHTEGRNDGFTWTFTDGVRQTPSLGGPAAHTAPVTWTLDVESVAHEAQITSSGRMGGSGLSDLEATRIEAFVDWQSGVDTERKGEDSDLVRLGDAVFHSEQVGCASCHSGKYLTDNGFHPMFGLEAVNTPSLVGVSASAPYLHDGSAKTLRALLERVRDGEMGDTSSLSDHELDALEAYLKSL